NAQEIISHGAIKMALVDERFGALIGPDAVDAGLPQVRASLGNLGIALASAKADTGILLLTLRFLSGDAPLGIVQVIRFSGGRCQVRDGVFVTDAAHGDLFGLLLDLLPFPGRWRFLTPAEIALVVPDHGRRGGVLLFLPAQRAVLPLETV